jgi:murein DD-endopeptidase MepM/ murein hydrolase activator NlpD
VDAVIRARAAVVLSVLAWSLLPTAAAADAWQWPLAGPHEVSRDFAPPATRFGAGHRGVDLPAEAGAVVRAAGAGRISYAGLLAGRGVVVVVHGELRTTYEPVTSLHPLGSQVAAGEPIGRLEPGHLGCASAACLHWGLKRGEEYLDPTRLVDRGPVRLLPVPGGASGEALINVGVPPVAGAAQARKPGVDQPAVAGGSESGPPPEVSEPAWSLRAAEAPLGAAAVAALLLGVGLLARPRPRPPDPVSGGATAAAVLPVAPEDPDRPEAQLLDLDSARLRRRVAS